MMPSIIAGLCRELAIAMIIVDEESPVLFPLRKFAFMSRAGD